MTIANAQEDRLVGRVAKVRQFNRFYTRLIGVLREGLLGSPLSLTEARVLFELAHREQTTASELVSELDLDPGYISRILAAFQKRGLLEREPSTRDARLRVVRLTDQGKEAFADLNARSQNEIENMLSKLTEDQQEEMVRAMEVIEMALGGSERPAVAFFLRPHRVGDIGWLIHRHGVLYAQEYGWDESFEALIAVILGNFAKKFDPSRERSWVAESNGRAVGCVFVTSDSDVFARLKCLLVEPRVRGLGLGTRLVQECIDFARGAGYQKLTLWTNDVLTAARRIYERAGFALVEQKAHHSFGHDLVGETWDLDLGTASSEASRTMR